MPPTTVEPFSPRAVRKALAQEAYHRNRVRIADPELAGYPWLVTSPQGVFAVAEDRVKIVLYGWFFGIHRSGDTLYLFENCAPRESGLYMGRIVRLKIADGRLTAPAVVATGLHHNCHQLAVVDGLLCLLDTANQAILRFELDGRLADIQRPFPSGQPDDASGAYLHVNALAKVGDRIAIMLHNGKAVPQKQSELAWLDTSWKLLERQVLPGNSCHDILEDEHGTLWHTASMSGEIIGSDGTRVLVTDQLMTRGLALKEDAMIVGIATFGPRHIRDKLQGGVVIYDRNFNRRATLVLPGVPADIVAL